jgi:hypothetical protein
MDLYTDVQRGIPLQRIRQGHSSSDIGSFASLVALAVIFAGFVLYQISVDEQWISPVLGGFFTAGCVIGLMIMAYPYGRLVVVTGVSKEPLGWVLFSFLFLYGITVLVNAESTDPLITTSHASYWFKWYVFFILARMLDTKNERFKGWTIAATAIIVLSVLSRADEGGLNTSEVAQIINLGFGLDYQGIGHALLVVSTCAAVAQTRRNRTLLYFFTVIGLFYSGARSELVAFLVAAAIIEFCYVRNISVMLVFSAMMLTLFVAIVNIVELPEHRVFNLLRIGSDDSARERIAGISEAIETITKSPLLGNYASYTSGQYAHNIISAWVDLGLLGFVLLLIILVIPTWKLTRSFAKCRDDPLYVLTLCMFFMSILLLLFAKQFTYQTIPLGVGLYCRWKSLGSGRQI